MRAKRAIDIVLGTVLAVLALPLIVALAIGSAIALRAWPIFLQPRMGKGGRVFPMPKLRTLPAHTHPDVDKYEIADIVIPRYCRFLRRTHLDELPQLFCVPLGWMSLVGPRPDTPAQMQRFPRHQVALRMQVRPGCTGLWQISQVRHLFQWDSPEYDVAYVERGGIRTDVWIMWRTIGACASSRFAVKLDDVPTWAWARSSPVDLVGAERSERSDGADDELAAKRAAS
jgi:lipopolysaccharide/colanic/teichoic acid biosynthesis glycosyltransferase